MYTTKSLKRAGAFARFGLLIAIITPVVLVSLLVRPVSADTPLFKQTAAKEVNSGTTNSVAFPSANTAGNLIVVYVSWGNAGSVSLTDTRGNAYASTSPAVAWNSSSNWRAQIFYAKSVAGGANTVTATFSSSASGNFGIVYVNEYAGMDKVNPLDVSTGVKGSGAAMNSGSATTTNANDLIFGAGSAPNVTAGGTGFTTRSTFSGNRTEDKNVTTTGSYNATATGTGQWVMQMAAFKADTGIDTSAPLTPANLTATAVSSTQVNLAWNMSIDNVGVTGYQLERCLGAGCSNFSLLTTTTGTTYNNTGLSPSSTYSYRVRAADAAGNLSGYSNVASVTTPGLPDTTAPSVPTGLSGTGLSTSQINLTWAASTDNVAVTGYRIFRNGIVAGTSPTASYQDNGLALNTSYSYTVSAYDAAGNNSAQSSAVNASTLPDTTAPSVPTNLTLQVISSTQITLSWGTSTDNVGVTGYKVYRDGTYLTTTTVTPFQNPGLTAGTTYSYTVSAVDAAGNESSQTPAKQATTPTPDTVAPSASMTAPALGATVSGTVTVSANATDNVGVHDVEILLDGVTIFDDTTAPYSYDWDTTTTSNGQHTLSARAHDNAGNFGITSGVVTVNVNNQSGPALPVGLEGAWAFNEPTGSTAADVSGNNNVASLFNGPQWTNGKYVGGLSFDGTNDYATVADSPTMNVSGNALTVSMWLKPSGGSNDMVPFGKFWNGTAGSPFYQYGLELQSGGIKPVFYIGTTGNTTIGATMSNSLVIGQWSHLTMVFNGSTLTFYVDGVLVNSAPMSGSIASRVNSTIRIGSDTNNQQFYKGVMDDLRVYNRALSAAEVQTDKNTPLSANTGNGPTIVIDYPTNNAQVRGIITPTADADDATGVQFYVDGTPVGPEDTTEPYGANWDTRAFSNGAHTLTARAHDAAGNVTVASPVTVNVANSDYFQNEILATGLNLPTAMKFLPDGRMLVSELGGKIRIVPAPYTTPDPTPFLTITNIGVGGVQEGIFDFALDPNFATNHYYYVYYTAHDPIRDRLSRFTANAASTGTVAGSELVLYEDPRDLQSDEHHGGGIAFSNDGKIFFTTGEHFQGAPAQDLTSPFGKIHRINMDGSAPTDNPYYDGAGPNWDSVWAIGLRNPYRAFFDAPTNRLFVGDVGGNDYNTAYEEINLGAKGANYGWPNCEFGTCGSGYTPSLYAYPHLGRDASVTGGFVYHGTGMTGQFPSGFEGSYFFADYAQNWIRRISFDADGNVAGVFNFEPMNDVLDGPTGDVVYLTEGPDGSLYYIDLGYSDTTGSFGISKIRRIRYQQANQSPIAVAGADITSGPPPLTVNFNSTGSSDPEGVPLTYSWDFGDGSALVTTPGASHTYTVAGIYTVRLTVSDGVTSTFSPPLTVSVGSAPVATITGPVDGMTFKANDLINFAGTATDAEDGVLPASAYAWTIDFLHEGHTHPGPVITGTKSAGFVIPNSGHDFSGNTRYRITLTVTDSNGLKDVKTVTVWPQKVNLTFNSTPPGVTLYLDGIAKTTPFVYDTLVGYQHTIEARNATVGNSTYTFASWSDGGAQTHVITVPAADSSYSVNYTVTTASNGPVAGWGFGEGSGTSSADSTGHGNTATLVNGATYVAGKTGTGLSLDGTNDYLSVPNSSGLDISGNALTVSMWLNPSLITSDRVVFGKFWGTTMTSPYYQYGLELQSGKPDFLVGTASGVREANMGTALPINQWSHLTIVFNGTQVQFYVNGTLVTTKPLVATITARGNQFRLGADSNTQQFFKGTMDDVRVYNRVLTAAEVLSDMNTGL